MPVITPTTLLDEVEAIYSDSQLVREKESDVFYHFSAVVDSMTNEELQVLFKWVTGSTTMPPLGLGVWKTQTKKYQTSDPENPDPENSDPENPDPKTQTPKTQTPKTQIPKIKCPKIKCP